MNRNKTARQHNFAIVPSADTPRSKFAMRQTRKQAFNASELIPVMCEEILPGDVWQHSESIMARLATPIAPAVDDIDLETFYFFVPNRIVDPNWEDFITNEDDALVVPKLQPLQTGVGSVVVLGGVLDHFGILPQTYSADAFYINALPIRGYFMIYNHWFRDQNLQAEWEYLAASNTNGINNGTDSWDDQECLRANKRHDYFTSSLPWPQKGDPVSIALGGIQPVLTQNTNLLSGTHFPINYLKADGTGAITGPFALSVSSGSTSTASNTASNSNTGAVYPANMYVNTASSITINEWRLAVAAQHMLESDARGGSRYVEQLLSKFNVRSPDFRLQRPEYLGGSKIPITVNPIAQTAAYDAEPADAASPVGNLGAEMHASGHNRTFTYAATEHGYLIGLAVVRATPTYQQGTRRHWSRTTRNDFYWPELALLGEQGVTTQEIFQPTTNVPTNATWGYQERNAEYRYTPNEITGVLRSTAPQPLDWWHYSEEFSGEPALNASFITDKTQETLARSLATAPSAQWSAQIIMDILHDNTVARLMPAYAKPGLTRF